MKRLLIFTFPFLLVLIVMFLTASCGKKAEVGTPIVMSESECESLFSDRWEDIGTIEFLFPWKRFYGGEKLLLISNVSNAEILGLCKIKSNKLYVFKRRKINFVYTNIIYDGNIFKLTENNADIKIYKKIKTSQ